jgi:hypothetical protein
VFGFAVYQNALEIELGLRAIPSRRELELPVLYKGRTVKANYKADFFCFESIVVELKALFELTGIHKTQVINYLKATASPAVFSSFRSLPTTDTLELARPRCASASFGVIFLIAFRTRILGARHGTASRKIIGRWGDRASQKTSGIPPSLAGS